MSRVRLTARGREAADQTPYPGNVNQPDRKDPSWDQYHTFEQRKNHELPDMANDWKNDERDDIGFGIPEPWGKSPTVASVRVAANKSVRAAVLLLGEKVDEDVIEAQARDFMALGPDGLDRTLQRFADTQALYADDDGKKDEPKKDEPPKVEEVKASDCDKKVEEVKAAADEAKHTPEIAVPGAEVKAADEPKKDDEKTLEAKIAAMIEAAIPKFIQDKIDKRDKKSADESEKKDEVKEEPKKDEEKAAAKKDDKSDKKAEEVVEEPKKDEKVEEVKAADEPKVEEKKEEKVEEVKAAVGDMDIELTASMDDALTPDPEADERLSSLFEAAADDKDETSKKVEASQKAGIKKLGGQPRVASASDAGVDISNIWDSAPDVSEVFR